MNYSLAGHQHFPKTPTLLYRTNHRVVVTRVLGLVGPALPYCRSKLSVDGPYK